MLWSHSLWLIENVKQEDMQKSRTAHLKAHLEVKEAKRWSFVSPTTCKYFKTE